MTAYNLDHLIQLSDKTIGPIQDDEALFLFALCKIMGVKTVIEFGYGTGYSTKNFLAAGCIVYSVDIKPFTPLSEVHHCLIGDCADLNYDAIKAKSIDLIFFDCHSEEGQLKSLDNLSSFINDNTIIALHDTGEHDELLCRWSTLSKDGRYIHCGPERRMVNRLHEIGWDAIVLTPPKGRIPYRHGITLMKRWKSLET